MDTNKTFAISISGTFCGIYGWGRGFISEDVRSRWDWFWKVEFRKKGYLHWKYADGDNWGGCGHLSCIGGSIYMHPMDFNSVLTSIGKCFGYTFGEDGKQHYLFFESEVRELKEICEDCAEFCGGTFSLLTSDVSEIDLPQAEWEYKGRDAFIVERCPVLEG